MCCSLFVVGGTEGGRTGEKITWRRGCLGARNLRGWRGCGYHNRSLEQNEGTRIQATCDEAGGGSKRGGADTWRLKGSKVNTA